MSRILAIDYGTKRCGIAVSDPLGIVANPLTVVPTPSLMSFLSEYFAQEQVAVVVIGKPVDSTGSLNPLWNAIEQFARQLTQQHPRLRVDYVDERFTSRMAQRTLSEMGLPKKKRQNKALLDRVSAVLLLQHYLSKHHP